MLIVSPGPQTSIRRLGAGNGLEPSAGSILVSVSAAGGRASGGGSDGGPQPGPRPGSAHGAAAGRALDQRNEDLAVVNPYTGEEIARVAVGGPATWARPSPTPWATSPAASRPSAPRCSSARPGSWPTAPRRSRGRSASRRASRWSRRGSEAAQCAWTPSRSRPSRRATWRARWCRWSRARRAPESSGSSCASPWGSWAISPFSFPLNLVAHKLARRSRPAARWC